MELLLHNLKQLFIAIDQLLNVLVTSLLFHHSWADETLSAHAYRLRRDHGYTLPEKIINTLLFFDKGHCEASFESEVLKRQMPPSERG